MRFNFFSLALLVLCFCAVSAYSAKEAVIPPQAVIAVDRNIKYQEIEGFGFFGGMDVWWNSPDPNHFYDQKWLDMAIDDFGLTMWRNELYPHIPVNANTNGSRPDGQDAWWDKQRPLIQALKAKADASKVDLRFILTVWSPPSEFKCRIETDENNYNKPTGKVFEDVPNPGATKKGGTVRPLYYKKYAEWLVSALKMYKEAGADIYALSLQNEPQFEEPYNSCQYTPEQYAGLLKTAVPIIKQDFPAVKIFGAEHMLRSEEEWERYTGFHNAIRKDQDALRCLDVWAFHGYNDGVHPTGIKMMKRLWGNALRDSGGKPVWMTETSGFNNNWENGAFELAFSVHSALSFGHASGWVFWYGSGNLFFGAIKTKQYYAMKHFSRFIRPGARMVEASSGDPEVLVCAFEHIALNNFVMVLINSSDSKKTVIVKGKNVPDKYKAYVSTAAAKDECRLSGNVRKKKFVLPPRSVVTIVNGNIYENKAKR
ncbi:MAG: hypothetical protein ACM3WV_01610 [Bacillota bacterium]